MSIPRKLKRVVIKEELVALTKNYICALILNQFIYWSERVDDTDKFLEEERTRNPELDIELLHGWVFKKSDELIEELMLDVSAVTIRRYITKLVDLKLLAQRHNPNHRYDQTIQYRPDIIEIQKQLQDLGYALEGYPLYCAPRANLQNEGWKLQNEDSKLQNEGSKLQNEGAIPEITSKTTSKTTSETTHIEAAAVCEEKPHDGKEYPKTIEKSLLPKSVTSDGEMGNKDRQVVTDFQNDKNQLPSGAIEKQFQPKVLPEYRTGWKRGEIKLQFLEWLCKVYLPTTQHYRKRTYPVDLEDAINWVALREKNNCREEIEGKFNQMLKSKINPALDPQRQKLHDTYSYYAQALGVDQ